MDYYKDIQTVLENHAGKVIDYYLEGDTPSDRCRGVILKIEEVTIGEKEELLELLKELI